MEFRGFGIGKMEVSISELYYSAKTCFREHEKGIVCGKVAMIITIRLNFKLKKNIVKARYLKESELLEMVSYYFSSIIAFAAL